MASWYDFWLVGLSVVIAMFASYTALSLEGRVTASRGRSRLAWLMGGASAMGVGIWSMHYVGMLAYHLPVTVSYHVPTVAISLVAAIAASGVALFVASRKQMSWRATAGGSLLMGAGIAGMHYIGMDAMRLRAMMHYNAGLVTLSIVLAVVISLVALRLTFRLREESETRLRERIGAAVLMGSAIPVMHYTGMAAAMFTYIDLSPTWDIVTITSQSAVATAIAIVTAYGLTRGRHFDNDRALSTQELALK